MTFASPTEHVEFLAAFLHVELVVDPSIARPGRKCAIDAFYEAPAYAFDGRTVKRHRVVISHPIHSMDEAYSTALHELGHAATVMPWHELVPRERTCLLMEELAWDWAQNRAMFWTERMEVDKQTALAGYRRAYHRGHEPRGWYPPRTPSLDLAGLHWFTWDSWTPAQEAQHAALAQLSYSALDPANGVADRLRVAAWKLRGARPGSRNRAGAPRPVEVVGV